MADRSVEVRLRADISNFQRNMLAAGASAKGFAKNLESADGRMANLVQTGLALAPALVPIGAVAVPAIAGLTAALGFAAAGAGVTVLAFNGIGDALEAVNKYQIEPTAENLKAMREKMDEIGPAGRDFVKTLQDLRPEMQGLQDIAQAGLFPGLTDGIDDLMANLPLAEKFIGTISTTLGELGREAGDNLSDPRWVEFFEFLDAEAAPTLTALGQAFGNVIEGLADMVMAVDPLSDMFTGGMLQASKDFKQWADDLATSDGFRSFVDYIRDNGPQAMQTLGAIADALVSLIQAAAPVGAATLPLLEALAKAISAVADSPAGPVLVGVAAGLAAISRAVALYNAANGSALMGLLDKTGAKGMLAGAGFRAAGVGIGVLALSMTDLDEKMGLSNTAMGALLGTMVLPGWGTAAGAIVGGFMDMKSAADQSGEAMDQAFDVIAQGTREQLMNTKAELESALADPGFFTNTDELRYALDSVNDALARGPGPADLMGNAIGKTGAQLDAAADAASKLSAQLSILEGFFDKRAAVRAYQESVDALREGLRDGAKAWDPNLKAGRENLELLDANATAMLQLADKMANVKARNAFLQDARNQLVAFKKQFPAAADAIDVLIRKLDTKLDGFKVDVNDKPAWDKIKNLVHAMNDFGDLKPTPKLDADGKPAKDKVNSTDHLLDSLTHGAYTAHIDGETSGVDSAISHARSALMALAGTTVTTFINTVRNTFPGGHADGGLIHGPGGPRDDRIPAMLSNGEFVVNAASARRNLPLLFTMNRQKFADGGMAGDSTWRYSARGGHHGMDDADHAARSFAQRLKDAQKELEKETSQRKDLISNMKSFKSDVAGSFDHDPFGNGLAGLDLQLSADRNDALAMKRALNKAKKKGLDGGLFAALAASGDLNTAQQLSGLSRGQIRAREKLFAQTQAAQNGLGQFAANEKFGDAMKDSSKAIRELRHEIKELRSRLPKAVEDGARRGVGDKDRKTAQRVRAGR